MNTEQQALGILEIKGFEILALYGRRTQVFLMYTANVTDSQVVNKLNLSSIWLLSYKIFSEYFLPST